MCCASTTPDPDHLPPHPGTYALILRCPRRRRVRVGRLGVLPFDPGYYLYAGSAFGPGGLSARLRHHVRPTNKPHWHIDYLRTVTDLHHVWYTCDPVRREHDWATVISALPGATITARRFGASDCRCESHLFFSENLPSYRSFCSRIRRAMPVHEKICVCYYTIHDRSARR